MDLLETVSNTTTTSIRPKSLTAMLAILERGINSIRTEMNLGMEVDETLISELETRVKRLQELAETPTNLK